MKIWIKAAMSLTKQRIYETEFGPFVIETKSGKARRANPLGKTEWRQVTRTNGYFKDAPSFAEFFLQRDGNDLYVSCSQGGYVRDLQSWYDALGATNFDEAHQIVDDEVVKCFQDYYGDSSIY